MAFEDVELTEEERAAATLPYWKANAIGDKFLGLFLGTTESTGNYGKQTNYKFRWRNPQGVVGEMLFTPPADAALKLRKANLQPGNRVRVEFVSTRDIGKESPMKVFKIQVDRSPPAAAPAAPPPPPPAKADDPFA